MDAQKLQLKIFVSSDSAPHIELEAFIGVFHRWIKDLVLPELLVDVANYAHVPEGPGVVLIGHGSDYFLDQGGGRFGLLHNRKRAGFPEAERLADLARRTLNAALLLEGDPALSGKLRFATNDFLFRINDRLAAPNTDDTFARVRPELEALAARIFDGPCDLKRTGSDKELFTVRLTTAKSLPLATLLERAGGPPAADGSLVS
jgi:hypothetical protein